MFWQIALPVGAWWKASLCPAGFKDPSALGPSSGPWFSGLSPVLGKTAAEILFLIWKAHDVTLSNLLPISPNILTPECGNTRSCSLYRGKFLHKNYKVFFCHLRERLPNSHPYSVPWSGSYCCVFNCLKFLHLLSKIPARCLLCNHLHSKPLP